jgi:hypothetical protein
MMVLARLKKQDARVALRKVDSWATLLDLLARPPSSPFSADSEDFIRLCPL